MPQLQAIRISGCRALRELYADDWHEHWGLRDADLARCYFRRGRYLRQSASSRSGVGMGRFIGYTVQDSRRYHRGAGVSSSSSRRHELGETV